MRVDLFALGVLLAAAGVAVADPGRPVGHAASSLWAIPPTRAAVNPAAIYPPVAATRRPSNRTAGSPSLWEEPARRPAPVPPRPGAALTAGTPPPPLRPAPARVRPAPAFYRALAERHAARFGLPVDLVLAVIQVESNFRVDAVSPKNARGLMQLVPTTGGHDALRYVTGNPGVAPPTAAQLADPDTNVFLGVAYFRLILDQHIPAQLPWPVRRDLALAAYNWGPDRVTRRLIGALPPQSEGDFLARLDQFAPPETRGYVHKIRRLLAAGSPPPWLPAPPT